MLRNESSPFQKELLVNAKDRKRQVWERNSLRIPLWTSKVLWQKPDYIHNNPVRAGLCTYPWEYKYSSARYYLKNERSGISWFILMDESLLVKNINKGENGAPKAFINIILFDKNYKFLDFAWAQVTSSGAPDYLMREYTIKETGYAYLYISNEHPTQADVYFDDVKISYTPSNVIQYNEYYPFGLQTANSWTRENTTGNNFLANGGTELNTTSNLYDLAFRNYDPVLGRMNGVDPMAGKYASVTPYNFAFNDPVGLNDPSGADPYSETINHSARVSPNYTSYTYDDRVDYHRGEFFNWGGTSLSRQFHMGGRSSSMIDWSYAPSMEQLNQMKHSPISMGSGLAGLTNAMIYLGAVKYDMYGAGTFQYKVGVKNYGGTYHTTNGVVTSTATGLMLQSGEQIGDLVISEYDEVKVTQGNCPNCPSGWDQVKTGWIHLGQMLGDIVTLDHFFSKNGIVIIANGLDNYSLKMSDGRNVHELNLSDPKNLLAVLGWASGLGLANVSDGIAILYENDPLRRYFAPGLKEYHKDPSNPGYYWSLYTTEFVFRYDPNTYSMTPVHISNLSNKK